MNLLKTLHVFQSLTCTKSKEVRLVRVPLQQGGHAASHSLVAFVDELLAEVAVNLLGRHAVMGWQRAVDEVRQLGGKEKDGEKITILKTFQVHIKHGEEEEREGV